MQNSAALWVIIVLALLAANVPFINDRLFIFGPAFAQRKPLWVRLLEWLTLYLLVGAVVWLLEQRQGAVHSQGWPFYVTTVCLFLVAAYPGFVWRYLWRR